ncbi:MAG: glutamate-5-semialdehyde dehydrogenase [Planctomycetota bacterium]
MTDIIQAAAAAKEASRLIATLDTETKNGVLLAIAQSLEARKSDILSANRADMSTSRDAGLPQAKLARLELNESKLASAAEGLRQVAALPDPVGAVTQERTVPSGLRVKKVRCPLGVIAMIYEARPAVTVDAFALCFKAGNACILKGGKEANASNALLAEIVREILAERGLPEASIVQVTSRDRDDVKKMLTLTESIDLAIPRGGEALIRFVHEHAKVPTVQHFDGVNHLYIHSAADLSMALELAATAKTSAPATCNALECVLIDRAIANDFIPMLDARCQTDGIELRGDPATQAFAPHAKPATDADYGTEFLDLILAARVVDGIDEAIDHIARHGSNHTEAIVTGDTEAASRFTGAVQASCVLVNASTRFNDGFQLGLGAEIGISTTKLHAYGPMGLEELTSQRFVVLGEGQVR